MFSTKKALEALMVKKENWSAHEYCLMFKAYVVITGGFAVRLREASVEWVEMGVFSNPFSGVSHFSKGDADKVAYLLQKQGVICCVRHVADAKREQIRAIDGAIEALKNEIDEIEF